MITNHNKTILSCFLIVLLLLITGCNYDHEAEKKLPIAENNAVEYIKNKYGFTPEIIDSEVIYQESSGFGAYSTDNAYITMKYSGKTFVVEAVNIENMAEYSKDNYQLETIESKIKEIIGSEVGSLPSMVKITSSSDYVMFDQKYDSNNIYDVLKDLYNVSIKIAYLNYNNIPKELNFCDQIFQDNWYIRSLDFLIYSNSTDIVASNIQKNVGISLKERIEYKNDSGNFIVNNYKYSSGQSNGIYYTVESEKCPNIEIIEKEPASLSDNPRWSIKGKQRDEIKVISNNSYQIISSDGYKGIVNYYIPTSELTDYDKSKPIYYIKENDIYSFAIESPINGYFVVSMDSYKLPITITIIQ